MPLNSWCKRGMSSGMVMISAHQREADLELHADLEDAELRRHARQHAPARYRPAAGPTMIGKTSSMATMKEPAAICASSSGLIRSRVNVPSGTTAKNCARAWMTRWWASVWKKSRARERAVEALDDGALGAKRGVVQAGHREAGLQVEQTRAEMRWRCRRPWPRSRIARRPAASLASAVQVTSTPGGQAVPGDDRDQDQCGEQPKPDTRLGWHVLEAHHRAGGQHRQHPRGDQDERLDRPDGMDSALISARAAAAR